MNKATFACLLLLGLGAATLGAQQPQDVAEPAASPAEIQQMFDAVALGQAQAQLKLTDEQYVQFFLRFKALQQVRRRAQNERGRIIQDLRRMSMPDAKFDDAQIKERLKALQDQETSSAAEIKKASDAIDQVLDVHQQARFRAFEEAVERRKIELVTRARQNNRAANRGNAGGRNQQQ